MGTILRFDPRSAARRTAPRRTSEPCRVVIFPGVRIERPAVDLSYRLRDSVGRREFDHLGTNRPRKTS